MTRADVSEDANDEIIDGISDVEEMDGPDRRTLTRSIANRLTKKLAEESWTAVPGIFLESYRKMGLTSEQAMFLIHLLSFKWDEKKPYPGLKGIAATMMVDYSTVRRHAKRCRDLGLLRMEYRVGATCKYNFDPLFSQLETLVKEKKAAKASKQGRGMLTVGTKRSRDGRDQS